MAASAFLGLGIMGSRMAANLARAGHELTVYNRTREQAEAWAAEHGAAVAATPAGVGAAADVVITMVVDGAAGARRCCSASDGVADGRAPRARCASTCRRSRPASAGAIGARAGRARARASSTRR